MRRTPSLTKQVRDLYEAELFEYGSWPYSAVVAAKTGLTVQQVLDAAWGPKGDEWRRDVLRRYNGSRQERANARP